MTWQKDAVVDAAARPPRPAWQRDVVVPIDKNGTLAPGNIDLTKRPVVRNSDGSVSTVRSLGVNVDGVEVLIPTVSDDGRILSDDEAVGEYQRTGRHLGKFATPEASAAYAERLHKEQEAQYRPGLWAGVKEAFTGDARQTRATRELPSMTEAGLNTVLEGTGVSGATALRLAAVLATVTDPAEAGEILRAASPHLAIAQDEKGNLIVGNNATGRQFVLNPPGLDRTDVLQGAGLAAAFTPAGRATSILGAGVRAAATQTGIEAAHTASGGEFNAGEVAMAGGAGVLGAAAVEAAPAVVQAVKRGAGAVADTAGAAVDKVRQVTGRAGSGNPAAGVRAGVEPIPAGSAAPTPGTMGSVGSAGTDAATLRRTAADSLPQPIKLTEGQATRDAAQLKFEGETAKDAVQGARLRTRYDEQHAQIAQNLDAFVDDVGAQAPDVAGTGRAVVEALDASAKRDKTAIRAAYKEAEKAGELAAPVHAGGVVDLLNASTSAEAVAPVLTAVRKELIRLGGAVDDAGNLVARDLSLGNMELLRRFVNRTAGADPTNIKYAADLKRAIDAATEGAGGDLYKGARALRAEFAARYEDRAIVADLITNKRGMADRKVAIESVFQRSVLNGSADDIVHLRNTLTRAGDDGAQAWRELQGETLRHLREQATRSPATTQRGDAVISAAGLNRVVQQLDKNGRLDLVLGKQRAQMVRDLNDIARDVLTVPPGTALNTSNTAATIFAALADVGAVTALSGLPLPVLSGLRLLRGAIKDRAVATRVSQALGEATKKEAKAETARKVREAKALRAMEAENAAPKASGVF